MSSKIDTLALHAGTRSIAGAVATPVFHTSTYEMSEGVAYRDIRYARLSNSPNHHVLHDRLARIMSAEAAVVCGSGMAAISTTLEELVPLRGRLLAASTLYGGTAGLLHRWVAEERLSVSYFDATSPNPVGPDTDVDAIYIETIANPTMEPANLPAIVALARRMAVPLVVDNTFGSPVCVRPIELGADVVLHSATKYLNGHSDVTAGVVGGREVVVDAIRSRLAYNGAMLDPGAAYLLERGIKTLGVRVRRQSDTATQLVGSLKEHDAISVVRYPTMEVAPWLNRTGAMFAFELPDGCDPQQFFSELKYFIYAPSLGGVESLVIRPAFGSHAGLSPEQRKIMGVSDRLVRVSVGLEDVEDLRDDLFQALEVSRSTR